jgi:outer membrane protein OmpA-like peptidoglycan-associated protein/tetratricopeptide (TPR) repeat protein
MKKILLIIILATLGFLCIGQNVEFEKSAFPGKKEELKDAIKKLDIGTDFYFQGRKEFDEFRRAYLSTQKILPVSVYDYQKSGYDFFRNALSPLNDANRFNPNNARLNYMLGFIWFNTNPTGKESLEYFEKALALNFTEAPDLRYWLGWSYHLNSRWDEAIKNYELYLTFLSQKVKSNAIPIEDVRKKIEECNNGKKFSGNPERVFVDNLGPSINTAYPEYGPSITTDEATIYFTARRPNSIGGKRDETDGGYYEDVYSSVKVNGKWQASRQLTKNVNTETHDAAAGLSPDGSRLYIYRHSGSDGGDLYESTLFGLDWEQPVHMNRNINTKYHESSVSLSFDGRRLYFVSDKESGYGDRDIYYSEVDINGEWGIAKNIGQEINTKYGEEAVFMHPDGVTLYFSSKGHNSMGGYDIFKTTLVDGKWQKPLNLGYPINGPDDDVFFVVSGSGNRAYFASSKQGGYGEKDIYKITFLGPEKQPLMNSQDQLLAAVSNPISNLKTEGALEVPSAKLTILKGIVKDEKTSNPLESTIELIDNDKNIVLATFKSNSISGKYLVTLPSGKNYGIAVKSEGYLFHSENFNLPDSADFQEFTLDIIMKKIEIGNTIVLRNIFFDFDKATIRPESQSELTRLVKLLKDNPALKIELGSHTDNLGSDVYNQKLSDTRSKSVVDFLIGKGIPASRLVAKGYGETMPLETNETEEGRQSNRRTEFKILSK